MTETVLIRAEGLRAGYGDADILKDVSFTLREGERIAVIGPNGSGKTTLLRVLAGVLPYRGSLRQLVRDQLSPRRGTEVERSSLEAREAARETSFLAQLSASWFSFRVEETVLLGRYARQKRGLAGEPDREDREAVRKAMETCGVAYLANERISRLSGGQLQRVYLARALAQDTSLILLDEPTNHLDLHYQIELLDLIREQTRGAIGVFHDLSLAFRFADTVILLDEGSIADKGTPATVLGGDAINRVYRMDVRATLRSLLQNA